MSILPYIKSFADSMKATAQGGVRNEYVATYIARPPLCSKCGGSGSLGPYQDCQYCDGIDRR